MAKYISGQRFGSLTVASGPFQQIRIGKCNREYWLCVCDCGKQVLKRSDSLYEGRGGCYKPGCQNSVFSSTGKESANKKYRLSPGDIFGKLTVVSGPYCRTKGKHSRYYWLYRCACGVQRLARTEAVATGTTMTCGCENGFKAGAVAINKKYFLEPGMRFGRLVTLSLVTYQHTDGTERRSCKWRCMCDCGKQSEVLATSLSNGVTVSCGCFGAEQRAAAAVTHGLCRVDSRHYLYSIYYAMRSRCTNRLDKHWMDYGGRGIGLHPEWIGDGGFLRFHRYIVSQLGERPDGRSANGKICKWSLDRINNDMGYEPGNLRWATSSEQMRNTRRGKNLTAYTEEELLAELSRRKRADGELNGFLVWKPCEDGGNVSLGVN